MTHDKYEKFLEPLFLPAFGVICFVLALLLKSDTSMIYSFYLILVTSIVVCVYAALVMFKLIPAVVLIKQYGKVYSIARWILGLLGLFGIVWSLLWVVFRAMVNFGIYNENGLFGKPDGKG